MKASPESIVRSAREYLEKTGTSQAKLAAQAGMSAATLSAMLSGKWQNISEEQWRKLSDYVIPPDWKLVETTNFKNLVAEMTYAQQTSTLRAVAGLAGEGKTTTAQWYKLNNPNVVYVLCQEFMSVKELLRAILRELGSTVLKGTKYELLTAVRGELLALANPVLILDDYGKLSNQKQQFLQQLYDMTEEQVGIVLLAVDYVYDNLKDAAQRVHPAKGAPELMSRIGRIRKLRRPTKKELAKVAEHNGITSTPHLDWLQLRCKSFRDVRNVVRELRRYHQVNGNLMPLEDLQAAYDQAA